MNIQIKDQYGQLVTDFETLNFGRFTYSVYLAVASRDLTFMEADPLLQNLDDLMAAGMGGLVGGEEMMGSRIFCCTSVVRDADQLTGPVDNGTIKINVTFPTDGQYIAFLDFWPHERRTRY